MVEDKKQLTESEAQQIAEKFLRARYFSSKVKVTNNQLISAGDSQMYRLQGNINMKSRSLIDGLVVSKNANDYEFTIEIDAQQGHVINYEFT